MTNRNVPRAEWYRFFEEFTKRHREELVSVTVVGEKLGAQHEARDMPLSGIVADRFGKKLSIALGGAHGAHIEHPVDLPVRVWVEMDPNGNEIALEIESDNGLQTILELPLGVPRR